MPLRQVGAKLVEDVRGLARRGLAVVGQRSVEFFERTRHPWQFYILPVFLILLPFLIPWVYRQFTAFPEEITITTGSEGGLYRGLSESLADEIERRLGVRVNRLPTTGSLENLFFLEAGGASFGLYQPGTLEVLRQHYSAGVKEIEARILFATEERRTVAVVANLYSQPAHLIVHRDAGIQEPADLQGKTISVGLPASGDHSMSQVLLDVFDLDGKVDALHLSYVDIERALPSGSIDAAIVAVGTDAPVYRNLAASGSVRFLDVPNAQALSQNYLFIYPYEIPAGLYQYLPDRVPQADVSTVAAGAQVLTRTDVSPRLVEEVTRILLDENFIREQHLAELLAEGHDFALRRPEFPIHPGARNVYEPGLRPLINPAFIASTEGLISLIFSAIIALIVGIRWLKRRREHKLERHIQSLLDIERRHRSVAEAPAAEEAELLHGLLEDVITLKQSVFTELTAHELSEDRAANCFLRHDLSNQINAKLSRREGGRRAMDRV